MRILAFDTATRATTVALRVDDRVIEARDDPAAGERPRHASALLALATGLLERASLGFGELDRIAVGVGPGTFTGLRIGIASARALARAAAVPLVGVSTLQSLALNALSVPEHPSFELAAAVLDARRGEVFAAVWRLADLNGDLGRLSSSALIAPGAFAPAAFAERLRSVRSSALALGDGAVEFKAILERSGASVPDVGSAFHLVTAANHSRIAGHLDAVSPDDVHPEYIRLPDAEIARRAVSKQ